MERNFTIGITRLFFLILTFTALLPSRVKAEGTAELTPNVGSNGHGMIQIWDNSDKNRNSATFGGPVDKRLMFSICDPSEKVFFGISYDTTGDLPNTKSLWYRIISSDLGAVVFPLDGTWQRVTNTGAGSIANQGQALIGPNTVVGGTGGYVPLSLPFPLPSGGDYYIEFFRNSSTAKPTLTTLTPTAAEINTQEKNRTRIAFFDLTVAKPTATPPGYQAVKGRLFSKTWDITTNGGANAFIAKMYVYSNDGIVTKLDFNGIRPWGFTISCNSTGVANSGNPYVDRQSVTTNSTYADYKIFLNDPDNSCYGTGIFGNVTDSVRITGCDVNNRCINVTVDKAGNVDLLLNLDGAPGYQTPGKDVLIKTVLKQGTNCIPWNGKDGTGASVPAQKIDMTLSYYNGLTHLPLFDVEDHPNGFIVTLVRPAGQVPKLFWDDSNLSGFNPSVAVSLAGCTSDPVLAKGCHKWGKIANGTIPADNAPVNFGDTRTVNTWWYANYIDLSANYNFPADIAVDANTDTPGTGASNDISSCTNAGAIQLKGSVTGGVTKGIWTVGTGVTGTFVDATSAITKFTPSTSDLGKAFIYLKLSAVGGPATCSAVSDSIKITFQGGPIINPGGPQSACVNNNNAQLTLGASTNAFPKGVKWSGTGVFIPNDTTKNAKYTPSAADITAGFAILTVTTTGNGLCPAASGTVKLTYKQAPVVSVTGGGVTMCANTGSVTLKADTSHVTGLAWSGGSNQFSAQSSTITNYTPSAAELAAAPTTVNLNLVAINKDGCLPVSIPVTVNITPKPTVSAGINRSICANDSVTLAGSVTVASGGIWKGGTGKFSPNNSTLNAVYTPSKGDISAGTIILTLTTTGVGTCLPDSSKMTISFTKAPTDSITGPASVCENNPNISLSVKITGAPNQKWSGAGTFNTSVNNPSIVYTPSATEISDGVAVIYSTTTGGTCPPVSDTIIVNINPPPTINAGAPFSVCENNTTLSLLATVSGVNPVGGVEWTSTSVTGVFSKNASTTYTLQPADIAAKSVTLTVSATGKDCNPVLSTIKITITPKPTANAGPSKVACENNPTATFNGSFTGPAGTTVLWTGGNGGTFSAATSATTDYTATASDIAAGKVILTMTTIDNSTGVGKCNAVNDTVSLFFSPKPVVTAGGPYSVCANNATVSLVGTAKIGITTITGQWKGGTTAGFTPGRNSANATYTPTAAEIAAGTLNLTYESTGNGNCNPVSAAAVITFTPAPTITVNPITVCADNPAAQVAGTTVPAGYGVKWSGGSNNFSSTTATNPKYTPSVAEVAAGTATITATTTGGTTGCSQVNATLTITIVPAPVVNANGPLTICGTVATTATLSGTVTGATGGIWSKTATATGTLTNATNLTTATYTPSTQDIINGSSQLVLTSTGNGTCGAVTDNLTINFTPEPSIDAGNDQNNVCNTEFPVNLSASGSQAQWVATGAPGTFANVNALVTTFKPNPGVTGPVTLTIKTIASGKCPVKTDDVTITIIQGPVVDPGPDSPMCGSEITFPVKGTINGGNATKGLWTSSGTGSFAAPTSLITTYKPSAGDRTAGFVTITLTSTDGLCLPVSKSFKLTILPAITVFAGPPKTLCADVISTGFTLNGASNNSSAGVVWTKTTGSGTFSNANSLTSTYTPSQADTTSGSVTLKLSSIIGADNCPVVSSSVTFTITPAPTLTLGPNPTICFDSAYVPLNVSINAIPSGVSWSTSGTGTFSPDLTKYFPSAKDKADKTVVLTATTTGVGSCTPVKKSITVTITNPLTLAASSTQNVCENNSEVKLTGYAPSIPSGVNWTSSGTGTFGSQTTANTSYFPSVADIKAGIITLTIKATDNNPTGCKPQTSQVIVNIAPSPIVKAGGDQKVCANTTSILLNGAVTHAGGGIWSVATPPGGTFSPANALTTTYTPAFPIDSANGSVKLVLSSNLNGNCLVVTDTVLIKFQKLPIVDAGPDQTVCADSIYIQLKAAVYNNPLGFKWSTSGKGSFSKSIVDTNAVYLIHPADKINKGTTGSVTITLTSEPGICPAVTDQMVLNINEAPTVDIGADKTVCANNIGSLQFNGILTSTASFNWTTTGTGTFSPADNSSTSPTYTPSSLDISAGSVVIGMTVNGSSPSCKPAYDHLTLKITPKPIVDAGPDKTICADSLGVLLNNASITNATGIQWTSNGSGVFDLNNKITQPSYYPSATDKTTGVVRLIATSTGNGNCLAETDTIFINIDKVPVVNAGTDHAVCADTNGIALNGTFSLAGGVLWKTSGTGTFTPNNLSETATYIPSAADTLAKSVVLTITTTDNGSCNARTDQVNITIAPKPIISAGEDAILCTIFDQLVVHGAVFNATGGIWGTNGTGSFVPNSNNSNPSYVPSASDLSVGKVILTYTSTGNGTCRPVSDNVMIQFTPAQTVSAGPDLEICISETTVTLNGSSTNTTSVSWTKIAPNFDNSTLSSTTTASTVYTIPLAEQKPDTTISFQFTGQTNGCPAVSDTINIKIVTSPTLSAGSDKTVCNTDFPLQLNGTGSAGQWSSPSGGVFLPNAQTLNATYKPTVTDSLNNVVTLTLTSTIVSACAPPQSTVTFNFIPGPKVDAGTVTGICTNSTNAVLNGSTSGSTTGVIWTSSGTGGFSPATSAVSSYVPSASDKTGGEVILTLTSTGNNALCKAAVDTIHLVIYPEPTIVASNQTICGDAKKVSVSATISNATGVTWTNSTSAGSFTPPNTLATTYNVVSADTTGLSAGNHSITMQVTTNGNKGTCPSKSIPVTVTFTKPPKVNAGPPAIVCADTASIPLKGVISIATGGKWTSTSLPSGFFTPSANATNASTIKYVPSAADRANGSVVLKLKSTGNGTCRPDSSTVTITFQKPPTITPSALRDSICTGGVITLNSTNPLTAWSSTGNGNFSAASGLSTVYTPSVKDQQNGGVTIITSTTASSPCKEVKKFLPITIIQTPVALVNAGFDQIACEDASFFQLNGTVGGSGTGEWESETGQGDFYPDITDLNPIFIPVQADIDAGGLDLILKPTNAGICVPLPDTMNLSILEGPEVLGLANIIACSDTSFVQLSVTINHAKGGVWTTTGSGTFSDPSDLNAVYFPSEEDRKKGTISLNITTTGNGTCNFIQTGELLTLTPAPTINIVADQVVCSDNIVELKAVLKAPAQSVQWHSSSDPTGTRFINPGGSAGMTSVIYQPIIPTDTVNKVFNIYAKAIDPSTGCKPVFDTIQITMQPTPIVVASADQKICADTNAISINASASNANGIEWTTSGSGKFLPDGITSPATYEPSIADATKGQVILYATSASSGVCAPKMDSIIVDIAPIPIVSAGSPVICDTLAGAGLTGSSTTGSAIWSSSSSGIAGFSVNHATLAAKYFPTRADIASGRVTLTLTSTSNGTCKPVSSSTILLIEPLPIVNVAPGNPICLGNTVTFTANPMQTGVQYSWINNAGVIVAPQNTTSYTTPAINVASTFVVLKAENYKKCIVTDTIPITTYVLPKFLGITPDPACYKVNLELTSSLNGPSPVPGVYQWYKNGVIMNGEHKLTLGVRDVGTYTVVYEFGCNTTAKAVVRPVPTVIGSDIIACGPAAGTLTVSTIPATATVTWADNGEVGKTVTRNAQAVADTTKYYFTATDGICPVRDSIYLISVPNPAMVNLDSTSCADLKVDLTAIPTNIADLTQYLPVTYRWTPDGQTVSTITVNKAGTYIGRIAIGQCKDSSINNIKYAPYPISALPDKTKYCIEDVPPYVILDAGAAPTGSQYIYLWKNNGATTQTNQVAPKEDSTYAVYIRNKNDFCGINDSIHVRVICPPRMDVPTAFTPNKDGSGDQRFTGYGKFDYNYKMMVFNRWGEVIFISNDRGYTSGWDGTYRGEPMPSGVYPWIVTYEGREEYKGPYKMHGAVTLIR